MQNNYNALENLTTVLEIGSRRIVTYGSSVIIRMCVH